MEFRYAVCRGLVWEKCVLSIVQTGPYSNLAIFQPKSTDFTSLACNYYCILSMHLPSATTVRVFVWWTTWENSAWWCRASWLTCRSHPWIQKLSMVN